MLSEFAEPKHTCMHKYVLTKATEMSHAVTSVLSMSYSFLVFQLELFYFFRQDYSQLSQKRNGNSVLWLLKLFASLDEIQMVVWAE